MKWIWYILTLIIIYFICSARGCTDDEEFAAAREEQYIISIKETVKNVFMSDSLPDHLLKAYEKTAAEKLNDFAEYLKIVSDTSSDFKFRQHALEMAENSFIGGEIEFRDWNRDYPHAGLSKPGFSGSDLLAEGLSCWAKPEQINIRTPYSRTNDSTYTGSLSYYQKWISFSAPDQQVKLSGPVIIDIHLIRTLKPFGEQQLKVWDVHLGDIE